MFRSNPDGTELELVHRGLRNPQELVFDEHGNLFTGDNDSDQADMERLVYVVEGGDSGWRIGYQHNLQGRGGPWLREGLWKPHFAGRPAYLLPPVCNIEDGPSGLTYYPGTGLTPEYRGHFFITHFKGSIARSGIQTYTLKPQGASFVPTSSQQFIGGVLPTDVTFRSGRRAVPLRLGRRLAEVEQGPHLRHYARESRSGAGQVERGSGRTARRRRQAGEQPGAHESPAVASRSARATRGAVRNARPR